MAAVGVPSTSSLGAAPLTASAGPSANGPAMIKLTSAILSSFKPTKVFKAPDYIEQGRNFTSLDFDDKGDMCVSSSDDETIQLWDARSGKHAKVLYSKKYGVNLVRFTHRSSAVIYASTKTDGKFARNDR